MMLSRRLTHDSHVHQFVVTKNVGGWNVREQKDDAIVREAHHQDWHRVERDLRLFELRVIELKQHGWVEN